MVDTATVSPSDPAGGWYGLPFAAPAPYSVPAPGPAPGFGFASAASAPPAPPAPAQPAPEPPQDTRSPIAQHVDRMLGVPDPGQTASAPLAADSLGVNPVYAHLQRKPIGPFEAVGDFLLGGLPTAISNANYQRSLLPLQMQQFQNAVAAVRSSGLTGEDLAVALNDPIGWVHGQQMAAADRAKGYDLAEGATHSYADAAGAIRKINNPKVGFDAASGSAYSVSPDDARAFPLGLPGTKTIASNGSVLDDRQGVVGSVNIPQTLAPGSVQNTFNAGGPAASGGAPAEGAAAPAGSGALAAMSAEGKLDPQAFYRNFVLKHEGGLNPSDMNGAPTNLGFNQTANPDIDVKTLTPDGAAARFAAKNFPQSGAQNLPPALAAIHADTSFINPAAAQRFLRRSGGDPTAYMALRQQWMANQVKGNPRARPYAKAWAQRNADLAQLAGIGGGAPAASSGGAPGWSGPAAKTYTPNGDGTVTSPEGKPEAAPGYYGPEQIAAARKGFYDSEDYKEAVSSVDALNSLSDALTRASGPNGIIGSSTINNLGRAETGRSMTVGGFKNLMGEIGVPQEIEGRINGLLDRGGFSQETVRQAYDMLGAYTRTKVAQAQRRMANEEDSAQQIAGRKVPKGQSILNLSLGEQPRFVDPSRWYGNAQMLSEAKAAIARGAPRDKVIARVRSMGADPAGL